MSTLVAQTISNGSVSTSSANVIQGSAKAWVNYKGTSSQSIRGSYNVSSITYVSTGIYTVNMTNALPNANYAVVVGVSGFGSGGSILMVDDSTTSTYSTTQFTLRDRANTGAAAVDDALVCCAVFSS